MAANGVALIDCGGGEADRCFKRGADFAKLGYRTAIPAWTAANSPCHHN
jgi:hypothetical protein